MKKTLKEENPCWDGYEMVGMKMKDGKEVPNCVPKNESVNEDHSSDPNDKYVVRPCKNPNEPWAVWEGEVRVKGFATREKAQAFADMKNKEQGLGEATPEEEKEFHMKLDKLVHSTFGKSPEEKKMEEGVSPKEMDKIKTVVQTASSFMTIGAELKKSGLKYIFATSPMPIYIVQPTPNNKVAIVNKKYASKPDFVHNDIAVGLMEGRGFVAAAKKAKDAGKTEFEFGGKTYPVTLKESLNEGQFSEIDIMAREARDFKDFVKQFYKEYKEFPQDRETIKWLKSLYDGRSRDESITEGAKFKITNTISKKDWAKTHKDYKSVIDGVPYVMKMTDKGTALVPVKIVESVNETTDKKTLELIHIGLGKPKSMPNPVNVYGKWKSIQTKHKLTDKALGDYLTSYFKNDYERARKFYTSESVNESQVVNKKTGKDITKHVLDLLSGKIDQKTFEKLTGLKKESVNEVASRTAMEIGGLTGLNKNAVQKFVDDNNLDIEKVYQYVKVGKLPERMALVSAIAGRPGNSVQVKLIKKFK